MIPISKDERLYHKFYDITYCFLPPVGATERFLLSTTDTNEYNKKELVAAREEALKELEKEYKGKQKPKKKQWEELLTERTIDLLPEEDIVEKTDLIYNTIDRVLVGWEGGNVPFPDDGRPSDCLRFVLMSEMYGWYWEQFRLTGGETKK